MIAGVGCVLLDQTRLTRWRNGYESSITRVIVGLSEKHGVISICRSVLRCSAPPFAKGSPCFLVRRFHISGDSAEEINRAQYRCELVSNGCSDERQEKYNDHR
jgi:hypothetical protein